MPIKYVPKIITICLIKIFLCIIISNYASAQENTTTYRLSVTTPSYLYHIYRGGLDNANEHLNNKYFAFNYHFKKISIILGTVRNSTNDPVVVFGITKKWVHLSKSVSISSDLAYAGNFFLPYFSKADEGFYKLTKEKLGIAFAPYVASYFSIRFNKRSSVNTGIMLPFTFFATLSFDIIRHRY